MLGKNSVLPDQNNHFQTVDEDPEFYLQPLQIVWMWVRWVVLPGSPSHLNWWCTQRWDDPGDPHTIHNL